MMRDLLVRFGLTEVISYSFVHPERNAVFSEEEPVALSNALTENLSVMRTTIFPGLLESVAHNRSYGTRDGAIFEVGRSYHRAGEAVSERRGAAFVLFGNRPTGWDEAKRPYDYFDALGVVESVAEQARVNVRVEAAERRGFKTGQTAVVRAGDREVAVIGVLDPAAAARFEVKGEVIAGQLDIEALVESRGDWKMAAVSRYPGVPMVIGMFHQRSLSYQQIVETIHGLKIPYLHDVGLWDRFAPQDAAEGEVKTALGLWYQAEDRSLTQEEVAEVHRNLVTRISELLPVRIITT
jgi:phenylalanyl-tRNA synthetase beta chain